MESIGRIDLNDVIQNRPLFGICAALIVTLFGLNFVLSDCTDRVGLVVANTLITNTYVWNLVTSCFYEKYVAKFVVDLAFLLLLTKSLPIPSIEQFGLYFLFSILSCTIGTSVYCFFAFFTMAREASLITPIYGFSGVLMTILMFARHTYRNETVHSAFPKLTFHHLPILLYVTQAVLYFTWGSFLVADLPFSTAALLFTWSYLRFYYKHTANSEVLGDKSEDFTFVGMFPEVRVKHFYLFIPGGRTERERRTSAQLFYAVLVTITNFHSTISPAGAAHRARAFHHRFLQHRGAGGPVPRPRGGREEDLSSPQVYLYYERFQYHRIYILSSPSFDYAAGMWSKWRRGLVLV